MQRIHVALAGIALLTQMFTPATAGPQSQQQNTVQETGNEFLRDCTYTLRLLDGDTQLPRDEFAIALHCGGYLEGFLDGYAVSGALDKAPHPLMCPPESGVPGDQEVRIVVKWMRAHPE